MEDIFTKKKLIWYQQFCVNVLKVGPIPHHVAFIMDGNRRYATNEKVELHRGHAKGSDILDKTIYWCNELGIKEITAYAFSIENFNRKPEEVKYLMVLATEYFKKLLSRKDDMVEIGICIKIIGNFKLIPVELRALMAELVLFTQNCDKLTVNVAVAYTSQEEIMNSFQIIKDGVGALEIDENDINEYLISKCMYSGKNTRPDILIRSSGEVRFSDFLLWQSWNTNVLFNKVLWPSFSIWHLMACVFYYQRHYANQKRIENTIGVENDHVKDEKVEKFLKKLEKKRLKQLETYASMK